MRYVLVLFIFFAMSGITADKSMAEEEPVFTITIQDHQFQPATSNLPAGTKVRILIKNLGPEREGFNRLWPQP